MRLLLPLGVLAFALAAACGSASSTGLSGGAGPALDASSTDSGGVTGTSGAPGGGVAGVATGTAGATASGGATASLACRSSSECVGAPAGQRVCDTASGSCVGCVSAADCSSGGPCVGHSCVGIPDASVGGGSGSGGSSGAEAGPTGAGGWSNVPEGAWARCQTDANCTGGRVCTKTLQSVLLAGRSGGCVKPCTIATASSCDPVPPGGAVVCANLLIGVCSIGCSNGGCPDGLECVSGFCFWKN